MSRIIFMVDDDQDDREIFHEAILKVNSSLAVVFAIDGDDAMKILSTCERNPDVIFLDYNMPRMTGIQCLKAIKANENTRQIPVIMYTTSGDREEEKVALLIGADHYMKKTTNFDQLCAKIERLLAMVENRNRRPGELRD